MKVITGRKAHAELRNIVAYCSQQFGRAAGIYVIDEYKRHKQLLTVNPWLGALEPLLAHRDGAYRSLVIHKHCKLIYQVYEIRDIIYIADLWDTRREPAALECRIKSK